MTKPAYWDTAVRALVRRDPVFKRLVRRRDPLAVRSRGDAFSTLARAIVGQQISVKAAQSVWQRLGDDLGEFSPRALLRADVPRLRACGLSQQKAGYMLDLAARFANGLLEPESWDALDDESLIIELTQVKGIGRWTAEMFLIFYLGRPDVFPIDDLGLQRAMSREYNDGKPVSTTKMLRLGKAWSPWRSVATWYLWRSLDPLPADGK